MNGEEKIEHIKFLKFLRLDKDNKFQRKKNFKTFEEKQNFVMHNRMVQRKIQRLSILAEVKQNSVNKNHSEI